MEFMRKFRKRNQFKRNQRLSKISARNRSFNKSPFVRESHNCYSYFLNLHSNKATEICKNELNKENYCRRSQPGYASGYPRLLTKDFNCNEIVKRTLDDNPKMFKTTQKKKCPIDYYKGAVVVAPGVDYHYYRLNDEGIWTHKPGYKPSTYLDATNNIIKDPLKANRKYSERLNYKDFCGYTCIPRNPLLKHMKMNSNKVFEPIINHKQLPKRISKRISKRIK
jgi:hypothetical protein